MADTLKLTGLREMENVLRQIPAEMSVKIVTAALKKSAVPILDEARSLAPLGKESKGRTRVRNNKKGNTVVSDYGKLKTSLKIINITKYRPGYSATVAVSVGKAFWGMFLEFGTKYMGKKPFMRPAFESKKAAAVSLLAMNLRKELDKSVKRHAKKLARSG